MIPTKTEVSIFHTVISLFVLLWGLQLNASNTVKYILRKSSHVEQFVRAVNFPEGSQRRKQMRKGQ